MKNKALFIIFLFVLNSCSYNGSFQGLYSYSETTIKKNPEIFVNEDYICDKKNNENLKIYITNGLKIKSCVKDYKNAVVYIWKPKCSSKICTPLEIIADKCKNKNIKLFIVAEYYDTETMNKSYEMENPIFAIDTKHYKSNLTSKYLNSFISDLTLNSSTDNNSYLLFENGNFINSFESFELLDFMYFKNMQGK